MGITVLVSWVKTYIFQIKNTNFTTLYSMTLAMQRSSLREDWGVTLQYSIQDEKLLVGVKEVLDDSPAGRSLKVGDVIVGINDWKIQNIKQPEVAANIFRAAGNFVTINVDRLQQFLESFLKSLRNFQ